MLKKIADIGMVFATERSRQKVVMGLYECPSCLSTFKVNSWSAENGKTKGCKKCSSAGVKKRMTKTGQSTTRIYGIWRAMKDRCHNSSSRNYKGYGRKGVRVCSEWFDFNVFNRWAVKNGYSESLTIDRVDGNKGYSPKNCRWTDYSTQSANKSSTRGVSGFIGVGGSKQRGLCEAKVMFRSKVLFRSFYDNPLDAAVDRDRFIIGHALPHRLNNILG